MDAETHDVGSVGCLRKVKLAISVARAVMNYTSHTLLVGDLATQFAEEMGFPIENLTTPQSQAQWEQWKVNNCQPNFWMNVNPNPTTSCGPYTPDSESFEQETPNPLISRENHDTIGMAVIDSNGKIGCGTSTNGLTFKIDGRTGDSPVAGAGCYATEDGASAATGDGDVMMRFLPTYQTVESMRIGMSPTDAAREALIRIAKKYPTFTGALIAVNKKGEFGGAAWNWNLQISVANPSLGNVTVYNITGMNPTNTII